MASNIGIMDSAYFVGRNEILSWINSRLQINLTRIEEVPIPPFFFILLFAYSLLHFFLWVFMFFFFFGDLNGKFSGNWFIFFFLSGNFDLLLFWKVLIFWCSLTPKVHFCYLFILCWFLLKFASFFRKKGLLCWFSSRFVTGNVVKSRIFNCFLVWCLFFS